MQGERHRLRAFRRFLTGTAFSRAALPRGVPRLHQLGEFFPDPRGVLDNTHPTVNCSSQIVRLYPEGPLRHRHPHRPRMIRLSRRRGAGWRQGVRAAHRLRPRRPALLHDARPPADPAVVRRRQEHAERGHPESADHGDGIPEVRRGFGGGDQRGPGRPRTLRPSVPVRCQFRLSFYRATG